MKFLPLLLSLFLISCTDEEATMDTLQKAGYTDIQVGGYTYFGCGNDDRVHTEFRARNSTGQMVDGIVCCGLLFKGCTIRF